MGTVRDSPGLAVPPGGRRQENGGQGGRRRRVPAGGGGGEGAAMAPRRARGERGAGAAEPALPSVREGCPAYREVGCTRWSCSTVARGRLQRMRGRVAGKGVAWGNLRCRVVLFGTFLTALG